MDHNPANPTRTTGTDGRGPLDPPLLHDARRASVRRRRVGAAGRADRPRRQGLLRAARRRVPEGLVAERDQHRRPEVFPRPARVARARALGQADDRPRGRHDRGLGTRARLLRHRRRRRHLRSRADPHPAPPDGGVQLAGVVQRGLRGEPAMLGLLHPERRGRRWSRSSTGTPRRARSSAAGSGSGINLSKIRGSMEPLAKGGTASGPVSFMRGADAWAGTIKSGGKTRRAAKMVVLDVDHPDIREFIWCKAKEEDKAAALRDAGFDMSIDGEGFFSIQYQNANNSVRVTDEFMQAVENDEDWQLIARVTRRADRRPDPGPPADAGDRRGGVALRRPGRPVRHDDQPVAHVPRTRAGSTRPTRAPSTCTSTTRPATWRR